MCKSRHFDISTPSVYFVHIGSIQVVIDTFIAIGAQELFYYGQTYSYMMFLSSRYYVGKTTKPSAIINFFVSYSDVSELHWHHPDLIHFCNDMEYLVHHMQLFATLRPLNGIYTLATLPVILCFHLCDCLWECCYYCYGLLSFHLVHWVEVGLKFSKVQQQEQPHNELVGVLDTGNLMLSMFSLSCLRC